MKIKKTIFYSLLALQLFIISTQSTVAAQPIVSSTAEYTLSIVPKVDDIGWQYKIENNKMYKRLFNFSTNTPLSDWEPVTWFIIVLSFSKLWKRRFRVSHFDPRNLLFLFSPKPQTISQLYITQTLCERKQPYFFYVRFRARINHF